MTACCCTADVFLPSRGRIPRPHELWSLRERARASRGVHTSLGADGERDPGRTDRVVGPTNGWAGSPSTGRELAGKFKASMTATAIRTIISHSCSASAPRLFSFRVFADESVPIRHLHLGQ